MPENCNGQIVQGSNGPECVELSPPQTVVREAEQSPETTTTTILVCEDGEVLVTNDSGSQECVELIAPSTTIREVTTETTVEVPVSRPEELPRTGDPLLTLASVGLAAVGIGLGLRRKALQLQPASKR